jgi:isopenicillin-N N-acyltransferase-like protein
MLYNPVVLEGWALEKTFPYYQFSGSHYQVGWQHGAACRDLIRKNLDFSMQRLMKQTPTTREQILTRTLAYQPFIHRYAPFLDEEIRGMCASTGLSLEEGYFLQLRAEIQSAFSTQQCAYQALECTTFAISTQGTIDHFPLAGQNADLPAFYSEICIVMEITCDEHPPVLMLTPAGQVSYIGMNRSGLCAFANYLVCDGWRVGFPRYCLSRLALTTETAAEAGELLSHIERASSRNILLVDAQGEIQNLEFSVQRFSRLIPSNGRFVHSNHFISPEMLVEERASRTDIHNSQVRLARLQWLIDDDFGNLDATKMQLILRDRETYPHPLCIEYGDPEQEDEITIASVVAEPARERMWVAVGPPSQNRYTSYAFTNNP